MNPIVSQTSTECTLIRSTDTLLRDEWTAAIMDVDAAIVKLPISTFFYRMVSNLTPCILSNGLFVSIWLGSVNLVKETNLTQVFSLITSIYSIINWLLFSLMTNIYKWTNKPIFVLVNTGNIGESSSSSSLSSLSSSTHVVLCQTLVSIHHKNIRTYIFIYIMWYNIIPCKYCRSHHERFI